MLDEFLGDGGESSGAVLNRVLWVNSKAICSITFSLFNPCYQFEGRVN